MMRNAWKRYTAPMRRLLHLILFAALALSLSSCGGNLEKALVGKFHLNLDTSKMPEKERAAADMVKGMTSQVTMELKEDHKAEMNAMGQKKTGTWKLEGNMLKVTPQGDKEGVFEVKDGGKSLVPDAKSMGLPDMKGAEISFVKDEK